VQDRASVKLIARWIV